jgi:hypothetical protein
MAPVMPVLPSQPNRLGAPKAMHVELVGEKEGRTAKSTGRRGREARCAGWLSRKHSAGGIVSWRCIWGFDLWGRPCCGSGFSRWLRTGHEPRRATPFPPPTGVQRARGAVSSGWPSAHRLGSTTDIAAKNPTYCCTRDAVLRAAHVLS